MATKPIKFVEFPRVIHDPNFGSAEDDGLESDPLWAEAAKSVVHDPEDTRSDIFFN